MRVRVRADFRKRVTDGRLHQGITPLEEYFVIEVDEESYRIVDDKGEPILYPKELFDVQDRAIPAGWQFCEFPDGEYHLDPIRTGIRGFYEKFFGSDGDYVAQAKARQVLQEVLEACLSGGSEEDNRLINRDLERLNQFKKPRR